MRFAAAMMRSMKEVDYDQFELSSVPDFKLRVGVCTGKVIAGVVGSNKPLYDIWGDTVNIASRMDYTGERGAIHLPQTTARQLMNEDPGTGEPLPREEFNYNLLDSVVMCSKRGDINVKGKGIMTTYFVQLTDEMELVEKSIFEAEDYNHEQIVEFIDEEDDLLQQRKYNNVDIKKDSGFGSQGHLEVDKVKVSSEASVNCNDDEEEIVEENPKHVTVPKKLSIQELKEHYDIYEDYDDRI